MMNLLPEDYIRRRWQNRANRIFVCLFAVVIGGVLAAAYVSERNTGYTLSVRDQTNARYSQAAALISQMHELEARKVQMLHKAELAKSLIERVPRSTLLGVITNALPKGTSLLKLDVASKIVIAAPAAGPADKKITDQPRQAQPPAQQVAIEITGLAPTDVEVARLIANLARNPLTRGVDLVYSLAKTRDQSSVREFRLSMELAPGADAINAIAPGQTAAEAPAPTMAALQGGAP
ncbi:MAG: PilN domain-containing protein [Planctomycetaceae bacterium]|nr:PilN domain-containing protein [Planctomycetaceae bacterium]